MAEQLKSAKSCCSSSCKVGVHIQTSHPVLGSFCTVKTFYIFEIGHLVVETYTPHTVQNSFYTFFEGRAPCIELSWPPPVISRRHLAVTSGSGIRRLFGPLPPFLAALLLQHKNHHKISLSCARIQRGSCPILGPNRSPPQYPVWSWESLLAGVL